MSESNITEIYPPGCPANILSKGGEVSVIPRIHGYASNLLTLAQLEEEHVYTNNLTQHPFTTLVQAEDQTRW